MYETTYITSQGEILAAKTLQSKILKFSKFSVGSGEIADSSSDNIKALQSLINPVLDFDITKISRDTDTQVTVRGLFKNTDLEESFYLRELGLYAIDPDTEEVVLFAYINFGDKAEYINNSISEKKEIYYNMVITVDNADNVTITVNSTTIYVTEKQFEEEMLNSGVVVSATEPTEDRKKVWMQQGKNIILTDFSYWKSGHYSIDGTIDLNQTSRIYLTHLIKVVPNQTYYVSSFSDDYALVFRSYDTNKNFLRSIGKIENGQTFETLENEKYISVTIYNPNSIDATFEDYQIMFENGTIRPLVCLNNEAEKSFEEYIEPTIYIKNDNDAYEEFMKKEEYTSKIFEETTSAYNIRTRAYKSGKTVTIDLYTINIATALTVGAHTDILLGTLPVGCRPLETMRELAMTSTGNKFIIMIHTDGRILISHVFQAIATGEQVVKTMTFVAK